MIPVGMIIQGGDFLYVQLSLVTPTLTYTDPYVMIHPQIDEYSVYEFINMKPSPQPEWPITIFQALKTAKASTNAYTTFLGSTSLLGVKSLALTVTEQNVNAVDCKIIGNLCNEGTAFDVIAEYAVAKNTTVHKYLVDSSTVTIPDKIQAQVVSDVADAHGSIKAYLELKY